MTTGPLPSFPLAQQAQIVRANQRDIYHVASLKEQTENVLRSWLGTRWLTKWEKEVELFVKLLYYALTTGRAIQTLGEEYTDIWQHSAFTQRLPSFRMRATLILLPSLPAYLVARWGSVLSSQSPRVGPVLRYLPSTFEAMAEVNLAIFYLRGTYYDIMKRMLGIQHVSSIPRDPYSRQPSYSLLGILLGIRLCHRLLTIVRATTTAPSDLPSGKPPADGARDTFIDDRPVSMLLESADPEGQPTTLAEEDEATVLDIASLSPGARAGRNCTLCLEERTYSCVTECGHLFCWGCIVGWGREKPECPLCRQSLNLGRLLPIHNL